MEPGEAGALNFVRSVAVTTDSVAKANLPRMQIQFYQRILHGRPNAIVTAAVTPDAFGFRIVLGKSGRAGLLRDIHHEVPANVNKRPRLTPRSLGGSIAWLAGRRRDPHAD